jgi:Glyoxalase-like domain
MSTSPGHTGRVHRPGRLLVRTAGRGPAYETDLVDCATWISFGSRSLSTLTIRSRLVDDGPRPLGWVVVGETADEFEIRPTPDRVPGLLFVPVPEEKAGKNRLHSDFRPVDQTAEVERLLSSVLGASASRRAAFLDPERSGLVIRDCRCTGGKSDTSGRGFLDRLGSVESVWCGLRRR